MKPFCFYNAIIRRAFFLIAMTTTCSDAQAPGYNFAQDN